MGVLVGFFYVLPVVSVLCLVCGLLLTGRPALAAIILAIPTPFLYALAMTAIAADEPGFMPVGLLPLWFMLSVVVLVWYTVAARLRDPANPHRERPASAVRRPSS